jgi:ABC-type sugar transport system substrate-binding protein
MGDMLAQRGVRIAVPMRTNNMRVIFAKLVRATWGSSAALCFIFVLGVCNGCKTADPSAASQGAATNQPQTCKTLPSLPQKSSYVVGFVQVYEPGNPWTASNTEDMMAQAKKLGHTLVYHAPTVADAREQVERMQTLIDAKVDVIVLRPVDAVSLVPAVLAARDACIPVFTVNRFLDPKAAPGKDYVTGISADGVVQGQMMGEWLARATDGKAKIIELEGTPGASSSVGRKKGFDEQIAHNPGMEVVASKTGNYSRVSGHDVAKDLLSKCPQCNAVYAHNDNMALGALAAIRELGKTPGKDVIVVGNDGLKEAVQQIIDGSMGATVFNDPRVGAITFSTIERYRVGHSIEPLVVVKGPVIDRSNAPAMLAEAF